MNIFITFTQKSFTAIILVLAGADCIKTKCGYGEGYQESDLRFWRCID